MFSPMTNVYVNLVGGIGNQLFQIAAGFGYANKYNKNLVLDSSRWAGSQGNHPDTYKHNFLTDFVFSSVHHRTPTTIIEPRFNYDELPYHKGDVVLSGYFQSSRYFEEYAEGFKKMLNFDKYKNFQLDTLGDLTVAAHVRRGDYLQHHAVHYVCDTNYFQQAFKQFPDNKVTIFSDSIDYAIKEFENDDVHFVVTNDELQTLYIMSQYDNLIASNSSFSWWASFLGKKKDKIIVPDRWFNNFQAHDDIYRNDFTKLPV